MCSPITTRERLRKETVDRAAKVAGVVHELGEQIPQCYNSYFPRGFQQR